MTSDSRLSFVAVIVFLNNELILLLISNCLSQKNSFNDKSETHRLLNSVSPVATVPGTECQ